MVADGGSLEFLRLIEDGQIGEELLASINFEQEIERLKIISLQEGILCVGLIGE